MPYERYARLVASRFRMLFVVLTIPNNPRQMAPHSEYESDRQFDTVLDFVVSSQYPHSLSDRDDISLYWDQNNPALIPFPQTPLRNCPEHLQRDDQCHKYVSPCLGYISCNGVVEHEAATSQLSEQQLFYLQSRGIDTEKAISLIVKGFCGHILEKLPVEFSVEAQELLTLQLERSVL